MARLPFLWSHDRLREQVSTFVDGEAKGRDLERVTAHLAGCAECVALADELRGLKLLASAMPELEAPRSFRLTPAMAASSSDAAYSPPPRFAIRAVQMTAAVAVMALAVVVVVDLGTRGSDGGVQTSAAPVLERASGAGGQADSAAPGGAATAAAPATVPPFNNGGVSGAAVNTPEASGRGASPTPEAKNAASQDTIPAAPDTFSKEPARAAGGGDHAGYRFGEAALAVVIVLAGGFYFVLRRSSWE